MMTKRFRRLLLTIWVPWGPKGIPRHEDDGMSYFTSRLCIMAVRGFRISRGLVGGDNMLSTFHCGVSMS